MSDVPVTEPVRPPSSDQPQVATQEQQTLLAERVARKRTGLTRLFRAFGHSFNGLKIGMAEDAFRLEFLIALPLVPIAFFVGRTWAEIAVLVAVVVLVLIVELLNTAIEVAIDRIGLEWHPLSGHAKDLGSAAVLISCTLAGLTWVGAVWTRWLA